MWIRTQIEDLKISYYCSLRIGKFTNTGRLKKGYFYKYKLNFTLGLYSILKDKLLFLDHSLTTDLIFLYFIWGLITDRQTGTKRTVLRLSVFVFMLLRMFCLGNPEKSRLWILNGSNVMSNLQPIFSTRCNKEC